MNTLRRYGSASALALLCVAFMVLRWKKMGSLMWLDPAHWLNEISRTARGELPYRDFSFQYPPLVIFLYGWLLRIFGVRFTVVQAITDVVDIGVVVCCWVLIRRLLPAALHLAVAFCLVAVCATSLMNYNLFSYVTYSPSLQVGSLGVFLLLFALLDWQRDGRLGLRGWLMAGCGGFIAVLSKPESALASLGVIVVFAFLTGWFRRAALLFLVAFIPAVVAYAGVAAAVGFDNLRAGISGYGLATAFCPWWPTGVGVFGLLAALGEAAMIAGVLALPFGVRNRALKFAAPLGAVVWIAYIFYQNIHALTDPGLTLMGRVTRVLPYVIYTSPVLEPVLMVSIAACAYLLWQVVRKHDLSLRDRELLLIVTVPVIMAGRSLFSTTQSIYPEIAAICYPFLLILGPYYLWRFLDSTTAPRYAVVVVGTIAAMYGVVRIAGGWSDMLSDRKYGRLETAAGSVKLLNYDVDSQVYAYVMAHTSANDYVLDVPYGGGINLASRRRYPIFNVQLFGLGVPPRYEQLDLDLIRQRRPRLVIGQDDAHLGIFWGYGQKGDRACPCPRLVWAPDQSDWDPTHIMPVVQYIEDNYQPSVKIGDKVIWIPRAS